MSMGIKIVIVYDLFEDGVLLIYEGKKKNFLRIIYILERFCLI